MLLTSNASPISVGRSLFKKGKPMKIVMLRDTVVEGEPKKTGDKVTCKDETGIILCTMCKAKPAGEKSKSPKNRESDNAEALSTR